MITLEQVQLLGQKVESAIQKITQIRAEADELKEKLALSAEENAELVKKNTELAERISLFEQDQSRIEQGILSALHRLGEVENSVSATTATAETGSSSAIEAISLDELEEPAVTEAVEPPVTNDGQIDIF